MNFLGRVLTAWGWLSGRQRFLVLTAIASLLCLAIVSGKTLYHTENDPRGEGKYVPYLAVQDGHKMYLQLMSVAYDFDLDITNQVEKFAYVGWRFKTPSGRIVYPHGIGAILLWTPFMVLAKTSAQVANVFGAEIPEHGYTLFHQRVVFFSSSLFAWICALVGFFLCRKILGGRYGPALAALGILFGTNLYYYAVERPDLTHAASAMMCAFLLGYWAWTFGDRSFRRMLRFGLLLGACALIRSASLFFGIVLISEFVVLAWGNRKKLAGLKAWFRYSIENLRLGATALLGALGVFSIQCLVWKYHYESGFFSPPHGAGYVHLGRPMVAELLYSSLNGFFSTHPLAYFGCIGLILAPRRARGISIGFAIAMIIQIYINSCPTDWWAQASYGSRRMCATSLILVFGLGCLFWRARNLLGKIPGNRYIQPVAFSVGAIFVTWFSIWNISYAEAARNRYRVMVQPMCCDELPELMQNISEPVYKRFGNPFAFPANYLHGKKWDTDIRAWDRAVTHVYAAKPGFHDLRLGKADLREYRWNIPGVHFTPYLIEGFGDRQMFRDKIAKRNEAFRWTVNKEARFFLPLFLPRAHRFKLPLSPYLSPGESEKAVEIRVNGKTQYAGKLGRGWTTVDFVVPGSELNRGQNDLGIYTEVQDAKVPISQEGMAPLAPPKEGRAGVAVRQMSLWVINPAR